jgi:hypothetical protein
LIASDTPIRKSGWIAFIALLAGYLYWTYCSIQRDFYGYSLITFLFDYRHGITRRALEGELFRRLVPPPYSVEFFVDLIRIQMGVVVALFFVLAAIATRRTHGKPGGAALKLIVLAAASSPLVLKNYLYDQGRQDSLGLLLAEVLLLCRFTGHPRLARWILGLALIPLCLIADNQLFLFVPFCLVITAYGPRPGRPWSPTNGALVAAAAAALLSSLVLPKPGLPEAELRAYLQSKTLFPFSEGYHSEHWLYPSLKEDVSFTFSALPGFATIFRQRIWDLAFEIAADALILLYAARHLRRPGPLFAVAAGLAACYLPLFLLGIDYSRWLANLTTCLYLLVIAALAVAETRERSTLTGAALLGGLIAFQTTTQHHGFGIVAPLSGEVSTLIRALRETLTLSAQP